MMRLFQMNCFLLSETEEKQMKPNGDSNKILARDIPIRNN